MIKNKEKCTSVGGREIFISKQNIKIFSDTDVLCGASRDFEREKVSNLSRERTPPIEYNVVSLRMALYFL